MEHVPMNLLISDEQLDRSAVGVLNDVHLAADGMH